MRATTSRGWNNRFLIMPQNATLEPLIQLFAGIRVQ
jgi:hypothetical protein